MSSNPGLPTPSGPNGRDLRSIYNRHLNLKQMEKERHDLIEEVIALHKTQTAQYEEALAKLQMEKQQADARAQQIQENFRFVLEVATMRDTQCFIIFLIDAHQLPFNGVYMVDGYKGGCNAANDLAVSASQLINYKPLNLPAHTKVIARVYADASALADDMLERGSIQNVDQLHDFLEGFSSLPLFNFVNVSASGRVLMEKVAADLRLNIHSQQCKGVFFGRPKLDFYSDVIHEINQNRHLLCRFALIDTANPTTLTEIFTPLFMAGGSQQALDAQLGNSLPANATESPSSTDFCDQSPGGSPVHATFGQGTSTSAGSLNNQAPIGDTSHVNVTNSPRTETMSDASSDDLQTLKPTKVTCATTKSDKKSYAATAAKGSSSPVPLVASLNKGLPFPAGFPSVRRNGQGQRIDPPVVSSWAETSHVRDLRLCNAHFLRGDCPHGAECNHVHNHRATADEKRAMRARALKNPCNNGSACDDAKCIFGHICPHIWSKDLARCSSSRACRFPVELHGVDHNVVKT